MARSRPFFESFSNRIDSFFGLLEAKLRTLPAALVAGLLLLGCATIYVTPAIAPHGYGAFYAELSEDPWGASNPVCLRVLSPVIAHVLQLRGPAFVVFPLLAAWLFLSAIYWQFRRRCYTPTEALGVAALLALSTPILFLIHYPGYTDTVSYLLLFAALGTVQRPLLCALLFGLALLNHESNLLTLPWFLFLAASTRRGWGLFVRTSLLLVVATGLFFWVRSLRSAGLDEQVFGFEFYLTPEALFKNSIKVGRFLYLGIFQGFQLFWLVPIAASIHLFQKQQYRRLTFLFLTIMMPLLQLLTAFDTSRLMGLAFPAILFGAHTLRRHYGSTRFAASLWLLLFFNLFIPQYHIAQTTRPFLPLPLSLLLKWAGHDPFSLW